MEEFLEINSVVVAVFGVGIFGVTVKMFDSLKKMLKKQNIKSNITDKAIMAILHNKIYTQSQQYIDNCYVTADELNDLEHLYEPYKALGGNGTAERMYNNVKNLPIKRGHINKCN